MGLLASLKKHSVKIKLGLGLVVIVGYAIISAVFLPSIIGEYTSVTQTPLERTNPIVLHGNLNGTKGFVERDYTIGLNVTYPNGTLVTQDQVKLEGVVILRGQATENVTALSFGFQNCLESPITYDPWGITKQGYVYFTENDSYIDFDFDGRIVTVMKSSSNVTWTIDGDYKPLIGLFFRDGTNRTVSTEDVVIHVYPKEQLTQIQSNKVTLELTMAVFILGLLGVFTVLLSLFHP